jgi:hypothetical protein
LLALAGMAAAQPADRLAGFRNISQERLRTDLKFLASPALEGRLSLHRGSEVAIEWAASEFAKTGLKPLHGDSFLQPVPLIEYRSDRAATGIQVEGKFYPAAVAFPQEITVAAPAVFAGYGITAPELGYDDYAGIDVRGKIVVAFNGEPQDQDPNSIFNGKGATRYRNNAARVANAEKRGALALVVVPPPNAPRRPDPPKGANAPGRPRFATQALAEGGPGIPIVNAGEEQREALFAKAGRKPADLQTAIDAALRQQSLSLGVTAEVRQVLSERRRKLSYNVAGMIEGSDPALRGETILYTAHYDHDGPAPDGGYFPGADDDGSGTVGVVELARAYAANPRKPRRTVVFILFAAEERGLLGSYYYAARPLRPLASTRAVINFDMIGRNEEHTAATRNVIEIAADTSNEMNLVATKYSADYRAAVERNNEFTGLRLSYKWDDEATQNVFFRSDQYPFILRDIPAMWWFTGFHPDYHQQTDTWDRINYGKMEKILKLAYLTGFEFADAAAPPRFRASPR